MWAICEMALPNLGYAAKMTDASPGGGTQIWVDDATVSGIDWTAAEATATDLPP